jgi:hypothetical protein
LFGIPSSRHSIPPTHVLGHHEYYNYNYSLAFNASTARAFAPCRSVPVSLYKIVCTVAGIQYIIHFRETVAVMSPLGCATGTKTSASALNSIAVSIRKPKGGGEKGDLRCGVVDADILHIDRDIMFIRQGVCHTLHVGILRDDPLSHLI